MPNEEPSDVLSTTTNRVVGESPSVNAWQKQSGGCPRDGDEGRREGWT